MDGFSVAITVCRATSVAVAAVAAGLVLTQIATSWRAEHAERAASDTSAPAPATAPAAAPVAAEAASSADQPEAPQPVEPSWPIAVERAGALPELAAEPDAPGSATTVPEAARAARAPDEVRLTQPSAVALVAAITRTGA